MLSRVTTFGSLLCAALLMTATVPAKAENFSEPWKQSDKALLLDAYEYNPIDWETLSEDKRVVGFINKASDGLPPAYRCTGSKADKTLCSVVWKRYSVTKELYHTRRMMAKQLGYVWGAYHLGRPGNPEEQADHFIEFTEPGPDDVIAIDIEDNDPERFMSLSDAEIFAQRIKSRVGRWPILYTNGNTAKFIARNADQYPILSRLPLWYARYKNDVTPHFPEGNWNEYAIWQFASHINCRGASKAKTCPYRPVGTPDDIDVNVTTVDADTLRKQWPFGDLLPVTQRTQTLIASKEAARERKAQLLARQTEESSEDNVAEVETAALDLPLPELRPLLDGEDAEEAMQSATLAFAEATGPELTGEAATMIAKMGRTSKRGAKDALASFVSNDPSKKLLGKGTKDNVESLMGFVPDASTEPMATAELSFRDELNMSAPVPDERDQ